jgi:hypothetical protein
MSRGLWGRPVPYYSTRIRRGSRGLGRRLRVLPTHYPSPWWRSSVCGRGDALWRRVR